MAKSHDGQTWEDLGDIILPVKNTWEESIWAGGISKQDNKFVIYYTGTSVKDRNDSCKIGKAYSDDLIHWTKDENNPVFVFDPRNLYYSAELKLAFRDPFFFEHEGRKYIIFCAKDKNQPQGKQGCVGLAEETSLGQFKWLPPIYSPGIYFDGLECPALYRITNKWFLLFGLDKENGGPLFKYAVSNNPFGPFQEPGENILAKNGYYVSRLVNFKNKLLMYSWFRDFSEGLIQERLAQPKEVTVSENIISFKK